MAEWTLGGGRGHIPRLHSGAKPDVWDVGQRRIVFGGCSINDSHRRFDRERLTYDEHHRYRGIGGGVRVLRQLLKDADPSIKRAGGAGNSSESSGIRISIDADESAAGHADRLLRADPRPWVTAQLLTNVKTT
jgi:hypothetical protein